MDMVKVRDALGVVVFRAKAILRCTKQTDHFGAIICKVESGKIQVAKQ